MAAAAQLQTIVWAVFKDVVAEHGIIYFADQIQTAQVGLVQFNLLVAAVLQVLHAMQVADVRAVQELAKLMLKELVAAHQINPVIHVQFQEVAEQKFSAQIL